ncbi:cell adhesion molecule CEACAM19 isoform X2 [Desmodus rotundus]|uniref:cell adhesion molecule CEACAM19 isoform X2 n=1 Tax=Desmodus rotundus TaxID=9430 RepID=UPI001E1C2081|nr:carcinoembryonic antigen-related cell adhesion molecule 19 isoform X2 [Desmodus rotundus]
MEIPTGTQCHFSKDLLFSASVLALCILQGSWAALHIRKIPERPQKSQDLLLSVQGLPDTFQDITWYQGKETDGGTRLFSYIPDLQRPQRDGNAMKQRDIVGFPNGSMLLRHAQPSDSGTYHVEVTVNPAWTMRAKTDVQVAERLPVSTGNMAAIIIGSLTAGSLFIGIIAYLLVTRGWRGQNHRVSAPECQGSLSVLFPAVSPVPSTASSSWMASTGKPELDPSRNSGDNNIYEVMPSPVLLVSPLHDTGSTNATTDLLNPDPAPYCQLVPSP